MPLAIMGLEHKAQERRLALLSRRVRTSVAEADDGGVEYIDGGREAMLGGRELPGDESAYGM